MANKDLFKQAIAEAKSIREAAIANAKEALEESLTPHLKDMLAAKLQEMEDSTDEEVVKELSGEEVEEGNYSEEENDEAYVAEVEDEEEVEAEEEAEDDSEESEDEAEGLEDEEEIEVKDMEVSDLKDLIRDIISTEMGDDAEDLDNLDMDAGEEIEEPAMDDMEAGAEEEEIDLDELLAELEGTLSEEEDDSEDDELSPEELANKHAGSPMRESEEVNTDLNEALETINTLQSQLQEVNLLNAKLMYVNKVFKANNLNETQKVNIIAAFDKAETVKEVKLVFETVSENAVVKKTTSAIKENKLGRASKATGTTASKPEVINEVSDAVKRMQKLAGII